MTAQIKTNIAFKGTRWINSKGVKTTVITEPRFCPYRGVSYLGHITDEGVKVFEINAPTFFQNYSPVMD